MSQFRFARISLILAALGLNAVPALLTPVHAQVKAPAAANDETIRRDLGKLLDPAKFKASLAAKDFKTVGDSLAAAEALPNLTPYEKYFIERSKVEFGVASGNNKMTMGALEASIESGRLDKAALTTFMRILAGMYYDEKNYPKSIEWMKRYQKESPTPNDVRATMVSAYYASDDLANAKSLSLAHIADLEAAGKAPSMYDLNLLGNVALKLKDDPTYLSVLEKLAIYYPSDKYWVELLHRVAKKPGFNDRGYLEILRLKLVATKQMDAEDYVNMAELALQQGFFSEAKQAVDAGYTAGVLGKGAGAAAHTELRNRVNKGAADDVKTIATGEAAAMKAKEGLPMVNLGYAYVTMDQAEKGIPLMEEGLKKGGLKRPEDAKLRLGLAYNKAGRKADAIKAFEELKGTGVTGEIGRYWIMFLNLPKTSAMGAAAAAAK
jgi:tetratricopeptide (TPR) repeat protein